MSARTIFPLLFTLSGHFTDVLSAALDSGVAICSVLIYFALQYPKNGTIGLDTIQSWWGNSVAFETADFHKVPFWTLPENATFG